MRHSGSWAERDLVDSALKMGGPSVDCRVEKGLAIALKHGRNGEGKHGRIAVEWHWLSDDKDW